MAGSVILMAANGCFTNKRFVCAWFVPTFKKTGVSFRSKLVKRERSLLFDISRYLFASHEVNMHYLT